MVWPDLEESVSDIARVGIILCLAIEATHLQPAILPVWAEHT